MKDCTRERKPLHKMRFGSVFDASVLSLPISGHSHIHACAYALAEYSTVSSGSTSYCGQSSCLEILSLYPFAISKRIRSSKRQICVGEKSSLAFWSNGFCACPRSLLYLGLQTHVLMYVDVLCNLIETWNVRGSQCF